MIDNNIFCESFGFNQWIDIDTMTDWAQVQMYIFWHSDATVMTRAKPTILVTDAEGLARCFHDGNEGFDMEGFVTCRDYEPERITQEAKIAYIQHNGTWDPKHFEDTYEGEYTSPMAFAEQHVDSMGFFEGAHETLRLYFDWEAYSHDLKNDYVSINGHYFNRLA